MAAVELERLIAAVVVLAAKGGEGLDRRGRQRKQQLGEMGTSTHVGKHLAHRAPETEWERQMLRTEVKHYIDTSGLAYSYNEFYTQNMPDKVAWKTLQSDLFANLPQIKAERMPQDFSVVLPKLWRKRQAWDAERTKRPPYRGEER